MKSLETVIEYKSYSKAYYIFSGLRIDINQLLQDAEIP